MALEFIPPETHCPALRNEFRAPVRRAAKGSWRMRQVEFVRFALNNRWLEEQGVPESIGRGGGFENPAKPERMDGVKAICIVRHRGQDARV
jgi:hypothetical protein